MAAEDARFEAVKLNRQIREDMNVDYFAVSEKPGAVKVTGAAAAFAARMARKTPA